MGNWHQLSLKNILSFQIDLEPNSDRDWIKVQVGTRL